MWVAKLGGSLAHAAELRAWLAAICAAESRVRVVVPGGGPFADRVREAQRDSGCDDRIAHRMALLAMAQYGWLLHGLEPRLLPACGRAGVRAAVRSGHRAVWLPDVEEACNDVLPESWDVTSDSLALWLAGELGAAGVVLVKSVAPPGRAPHAAAALAAAGYIDGCFPALLLSTGVQACWFARDEVPAFRGFDGTPARERLIVAGASRRGT